MRWHYRLGHASFALLKQMATQGDIPKKLAKVPPSKCAGCLFGAMTKLLWRGKESASSHEVFVATKPGECVLVGGPAQRSRPLFFCSGGNLFFLDT
jgi:hypothetical protein